MARRSKYHSNSTLLTPAKEVCTAGLYFRLSVEDGDNEEYNSIANQRKICMAYLQEHREIQFGGAYSDNGYTGMNYKRPGYQALYADLQAGKINCVIVKDISRLGRHLIQTSELVEKTFPSMGIRLICVNDNYDSSDANSDRDSLLMPFKLIMNDTYVKDTSKRIRSSIAAKMNCGEYLPSASSVPYGYLRDPKAVTYAIDPEAAPVVRRIFELRCSGMAFNAIAKQLNGNHIPSPGKLRYDRGMNQAEKNRDALWIRGTIRKITGDQVYIGSRVHGKVGRERLGAGKKKHPKEEWQVIPNAHPPIVSRDLFEKVQAVNQRELERLEAHQERSKPQEDYRDLLRGKLFCADCGGLMRAGKRIARGGSKCPNAVFFNCGQYLDSNHQRCCNHYIAQQTIMDALKHLLDSQVGLYADLEQLITQAKRESISGQLRGQLLSLKNRREQLASKLQRSIEDLTSGVLDRETYLRLKVIYEEELKALNEQEGAIQKKLEEDRATLNSAELWLSAVRKYQKVPALDRGILDALVDQILISFDRGVHIRLAYRDPLLELVGQHDSEEGGDLRVG